MTPDELWEKYRQYDGYVLGHHFLAALQEYGESVRQQTVSDAYAEKKLEEVAQVMRDNGIETPGWIEHTGHDGKLVRDKLTIAATLMFWFDAVRENKITPFTEPKPADCAAAIKDMKLP